MRFTIGAWEVNGEALLARLLLTWWGRVLLLGGIMWLLIGSGVIPPIWRGAVHLSILAPDHAAIVVDGQPWPSALYAGTHRVEARMADGRRSWSEVALTSGQTLTITLPTGLAPPRIRPLPPAAPGMEITRVWWADAAWRVQSVADPLVSQSQGPGMEPTPITLPDQTVALTTDSLEPLTTLDAFGGKADVVTVGGARYEAVYHAAPADYASPSRGTLEVRGWGNDMQTVALSQTLTLVRWSPTGNGVLFGEQLGTNAEQIRLLRRARSAPQPLVAVAGRVRDVLWSPTGDAVVLLSESANRLTMTLIRISPTIVSRVISHVDLPAGSGSTATGEPAVVPSSGAFVVMPVTWSGDAVEWIAPDEAGTPHLWVAPLRSLIPERKQALDAVAFYRLPDGQLRTVRSVSGQLVIGLSTEHSFVVEAEIPGIPSEGLRGQWAPHGSNLLLQQGGQAWIVELPGVQETAAH